jgi:Sulfotransferase family
MTFNSIWIIGCPRSGTTFLTDYIGQYVNHKYNEPWDTHPINNPYIWKLPEESFVFKYCENWRNADYILKTWPDSIFVHIWRDPDNVINSMAYPKPDAYPPRDLYESYNVIDRIALCINRWHENIINCLQLQKKYPNKYFEIQYERIVSGIEKLGLPTNINFENRNVETNIDWSCNLTAKRIRNYIKDYNHEKTLAEYVKSKYRIF